MEKVCSQCQKAFEPHPSSPHQQCCGDPDCRKSYKTRWQRKTRDSDPDYRENQAAAQKAWRQRNPGYSTAYRKRHPRYAEHNRQRQRERNRLRRHPFPGPEVPEVGKMDRLQALQEPVSEGARRMAEGHVSGKMDRLPADQEPLLGVFRLVRVAGQMSGKMDSAIVEIRFLSSSPSEVVAGGG